ncbi:MAG: ABC transporter substrate-binding protein [Nitrospirae bacterium]|nr:MAG: ABC transporter substrate-binding protein [Nitrospirota bacterium]
MDAFRRGEIDLAYIGLPPAIIGIDSGLPLKCISGGHEEGTVIAAGKNSPSFPETDNLKTILSGFRSIGVPGSGSIHDIILRDTLESTDVNIPVINFPWADEALEAFLNGKIDAVVGTPALAQAVIHFGGGKIVWPPSRLWPSNPSYGIVVRNDLISERKNDLIDFVKTHAKLSEILTKTPELVSPGIARLLGFVDEEFVLNTIRISPRYTHLISKDYVSCTLQLARRMKELGYIKRDFQEDDIFDYTILESL